MIYLKYGIWNDTTNQLDWSSEKGFNELEFKEIPTVDRITGKTLRGRRYAKKKFVASMWNLTISADELASTTNYDFIVSLFGADAGKYSTWTTQATRWTNTDTTETEFTLEADKLPVEFLENHKSLPEVKLELFQKVSS